MLDNAGVVVILVLVVLVFTSIFLIMAVSMAHRPLSHSRVYSLISEEKILSELSEEDWCLDVTTDGEHYVEGAVSKLDRVELIGKVLDILHHGSVQGE